ncbi:putative transposase [Bifidobacterium mongoliense DSM 21395]|uniref:Mutator family transposase n=1 Tax=Bifidobacterium mongoliense DSM 21395 TaxID=1437603 RepID=A0A087BVH6_9BIFI|nr:putative transposase [Bifidobacterium mongoliense DSM 21395]
MPKHILQVNQPMFETQLDRMVSGKVNEILNRMLDAEADEITGAARYERSGGRKAYRAGHYGRDLTVKAGKLSVRVPKLKGALFESAVIERYRRREESVEEALIDMYLAGVSTRRVDDISQALWGSRMPSQTLSDQLKRVYADIDRWRNTPLQQPYPYVFMDGVWHKRSLFVPACAQWIVHEIGCHTCEIVNSPCSGGTGRSDDATCGLLSVRNCSPVTVWPLESTSGHTHERPCCA